MKKKVKHSPARPKGKSSVKGRSIGSLQPADVIPGEVLLGKGDVVALEGRQTVEVTVANTGDRPIQVGSHCHFFEVNRFLAFDRDAAYGMRLNIPAGTAVRFEPGDTREVDLVALGGKREVVGLNRLVDGRLDDAEVRTRALAAVRKLT